MRKGSLLLAMTGLALLSALRGSRALAEEVLVLPPLIASGACSEEPLVLPALTCPPPQAGSGEIQEASVPLAADEAPATPPVTPASTDADLLPKGSAPPVLQGQCLEYPADYVGGWPASCGYAGARDARLGSIFRGGYLGEANSGVYFSQRGLGPTTPRFDFAPVNFRLGVVLNDPCFPGCLRGSFQALAELTTAPVFAGFGDIVVGPTALLRYNYVQPGWRLVPYLQGGAGFAYTDAYQDRRQHAIGQALEFQLKAAAGFHYFINDHLSLDGEAGYIHISNADLSSRNLGINSVGGTMGITYYFP